MIVGDITDARKKEIIDSYISKHPEIKNVVVIGEKIEGINTPETLEQRQATTHSNPTSDRIIRSEYFNYKDNIVYCTVRASMYYLVMYKIIGMLAKNTILVLNNIITPENSAYINDTNTTPYGTILKFARILCPKLIFQKSMICNGGLNDYRLLFKLSKNGLYSSVDSKLGGINVYFENSAEPIEDYESITSKQDFSEEEKAVYVEEIASAVGSGNPRVNKALKAFKNILKTNGLDSGIKTNFNFDVNEKVKFIVNDTFGISRMLLASHKYFSSVYKTLLDTHVTKVTLDEELENCLY